MSWVGFEPTIPAFERPKTVHALTRAAGHCDRHHYCWICRTVCLCSMKASVRSSARNRSQFKREAAHSPPFSAQVTSASPYVSMAWRVISHRDPSSRLRCPGCVSYRLRRNIVDLCSSHFHNARWRLKRRRNLLFCLQVERRRGDYSVGPVISNRWWRTISFNDPYIVGIFFVIYLKCGSF
jgi:hypothetical protein